MATRNHGQMDPRSRGMKGDRAHQARDRPGDCHVAGGLERGVTTDPEDLESEPRDGGRDPFGVAYQRVRVRRRIAAKLGAARVQKALQVRPGQCEPVDRFGQCERDRVTGGGIARIDTRHGVSPPLETDLSGERLADRLGDAGNFVIEGVNREQPLARIGPREQRTQKTVPVVLFHVARAMGEFRRHHAPRADPSCGTTPAPAPGPGTDRR